MCINLALLHMSQLFFIFAVAVLRYTELMTRARRRQRAAFRPGTAKNQLTHIKTYVGFCVKFKQRFMDPDEDTLCAFVEFLCLSLKSAASVRNYISGVRTFHAKLGIDSKALASYRFKLMMRASALTMPQGVNQKLPITKQILLDLCLKCDKLGALGAVLKCLFIFAFLTLLRRSNLLVNSRIKFDRARVLCRGDVLLTASGLSVALKRTKTLQCGSNFGVLPLEAAPGSPFCPVVAFKQLKSALPALSSKAPLFMRPGRTPRHLTAAWATKVLHGLLAGVVTDPGLFSLHSFRRGGATLAFKQGVDLQSIKALGTWRSDAVWAYLEVAHRRVQAASGLKAALFA